LLPSKRRTSPPPPSSLSALEHFMRPFSRSRRFDITVPNDTPDKSARKALPRRTHHIFRAEIKKWMDEQCDDTFTSQDRTLRKAGPSTGLAGSNHCEAETENVTLTFPHDTWEWIHDLHFSAQRRSIWPYQSQK
jgi:hypothetical protein